MKFRLTPGRRRSAQIPTRAEARERYGIRGDVYGDCLTSWCCRPCSLTQERREIELEEGSF
jgi:Cys-rich protein (TIGR01571 family)